METPNTTLEAVKVAEFVTILRRERDTLALRRWELVASRWLAILGVKLIPLLILVVVVSVSAYLSFAYLSSVYLSVVGSGSVTSFLELIAVSAFVVALVGTPALILVAIACLVVVPFTVSIHAKALRQWWVVRRVGLTEQFQERWAERRGDRRLGVRLIIAFVVSFILCAQTIATWKSYAGKDLAQHLVYLFLVGVCLAPVFAWLAQRSRQRLEVLADVERLDTLLSRHTAASPNEVVLPAEALTRIAEIERGQIARDRVATLQEARAGGSPSGYAVIKSPETQTVIRSLDLPTRLLVEDRIQELSSVPEPTTPAEDETPVRRQPVDNTPLTLVYEINRPTRRITVVGVEASHG